MSRNPQNEIVRVVPGGQRWSCERCIIDRDGKLIGDYGPIVSDGDIDSVDPIVRGVIPVGYGDVVWIPLDSSEFTGDDCLFVQGPSWWSAFGIFALGWLGGYLAWVGIGKYQARQETKRSEMVYMKMNRKVPYVPPPAKKNWQR